jgi:hypothetical protein
MPDIAFNTFSTPHFKVIYQEGLDSLAYRAAHVAETAFPQLCRDLLVKNDGSLPRITITLTAIDDYSNGFSWLAGHKIELFAYPMVQKTTGSLGWIDRVVVHELTHQISYFALRRSFGIYSEGYYFTFIPLWFLEGLAQFEAEEWDKNREFLLRAGYNKLAVLDRHHMYGHIGANAIEARLLYEQGHALYRYLVQKHGRDIGGRILKNLWVFNPNFNSALKKTIGMDERTLILNWRYMLEQDYPLHGTGSRINAYAAEVNEPINHLVNQIHSLKRTGNGFLFTGIERVDVSERNIYFYSPGRGLIRLDGPDVEPFFSLSEDGSRVYYSKMIRHTSGALVQALYTSDLKGKAGRIGELMGEEPCLIPGERMAYVSFRAGLSTLVLCGRNGQECEFADLPGSVAHVYRPVFANGRIYFSLKDLDGRRKIGSVDAGGQDFRIEVEKQDADVRYPAVNGSGLLAYVSNAEGPFNVYVRETDSTHRKVTADPYGVFAPEFNKNGDSLLVIAVRDQKKNFNVSCFAVPVLDKRDGEPWHMEAAWKKAIGIERSALQADLDPQDHFPAPRSYSSVTSIRPIIAYPFFKDNMIDKPGIKADLQDPLVKHSLSIGGIYHLYNRKKGFEAAYDNHCFFPDIHLSYSQDYTFMDTTGETQTLFRQQKRNIFRTAFTIPIDLNLSANIEQRLGFGAGLINREERDSLFDRSEKQFSILSYAPYREVPLSVYYLLVSTSSYTGNYIHPLNAFLFQLGFQIADERWQSERNFRVLNLLMQKSHEIGRSFHTLFLRMHLAALFTSSGYSLTFNPEDIPRGKHPNSFIDAERFSAWSLEYRIPLIKDLGFSIMGLYCEMLTFAPFFDLLASNPPGTDFREFREKAEIGRTAGLQIRQRVFFLGKHIGEFGFVLAYDWEDPENYGFFSHFRSGF